MAGTSLWLNNVHDNRPCLHAATYKLWSATYTTKATNVEKATHHTTRCVLVLGLVPPTPDISKLPLGRLTLELSGGEAVRLE